MTNIKKPHIHAEVIKAWADGAEIDWCGNCATDKWRTMDKGYTPHWHSHIKYRVKPEPITVVKYHGITQFDVPFADMNHTTGFHGSAQDVENWCNYEISETKDRKLIAIVKTTFVDNVPVAVELVK